MRSVTIDIAGQSHTIRSDADADYVKALASGVDGRIREVQRQSLRALRGASREAAAVLVALQLADELEREKRRRAALRRQVRNETSRLKALLAGRS